eukprot:TRINITY_DN11276_c0_g2_i3.p1 TRINITY_DN11276_c0_g2~~TRINITY_DN11276_c0_g2_i3.p1  ORF type:complete len:526 (-),score=96.82 TRINITY_DN11276_c0_g2_i3:133-1710(-)
MANLADLSTAHSMHYHGHPDFSSMAIDFVESDTFKPFIIPVLGLIIGVVMMRMPKFADVGKLVLYFGAQSFMNIFMGWVFRTHITLPEGMALPSRTVSEVSNRTLPKVLLDAIVANITNRTLPLPNGYSPPHLSVSDITNQTLPQGYFLSSRTADAGSITINHVLQKDLHGCPVGFALTAMQQVISFLCFIIAYAVLYPTEHRLSPKPIKSKFEVFSICMFAAVFALNIALNNTSLEYISIAVNLIIRSCLPLTTFLSQQGLAMLGLYTFKPCNVKEIGLMFAGVVCAGAFTAAKIAGSAHSGHSSSNAVLGVMICIASLLCGSLNLALAGVLGEMKLSVIDTVAYMSVPATIFLSFFCFWPKELPDGEWREVFGSDQASNWQVLQMVAKIAPGTFALFVLSGVLSFVYNIIQFNIVHTLSPSATAFGGNFNKAALVFLTLLLPFLQVHALPGSPYIYVIWAAVIGNVAAFSAYSYLQLKAKEEKAMKDARMKALPTDEKTSFTSGKELESCSEGDSSSDDGGIC